MARVLISITLLLSLSVGCARTVYTNLHPQVPDAEPVADNAPLPVYWRHFFVWGWFPDVLEINAFEYCRGTDRIARIETEQSFLQGLVAQFAGYYVNVYSPATGRVVCVDHLAPEASQAPAVQDQL